MVESEYLKVDEADMKVHKEAMLRTTLQSLSTCLVLLLLLCTMLGSPLALLQGFAWARMLVIYSAQDGISQGIEETFSGEKPCKFCKVIEQQKTESRHQLAIANATVEMRSLSPVLLQVPPVKRQSNRVFFASCLDGVLLPNEAPPVPPPRRA